MKVNQRREGEGKGKEREVVVDADAYAVGLGGFGGKWIVAAGLLLLVGEYESLKFYF